MSTSIVYAFSLIVGVEWLWDLATWRETKALNRVFKLRHAEVPEECREAILQRVSVT